MNRIIDKKKGWMDGQTDRDTYGRNWVDPWIDRQIDKYKERKINQMI